MRHRCGAARGPGDRQRPGARLDGGSVRGARVLGTALLTFGVAEGVGGNGFIAAFIAGVVFGNGLRGRCRFLFEFAEAEGRLLTLLTFLVFGAAVLPQAIGRIEPAMWPYAGLSLTFVRAVPVLLALAGTRLHLPTKGVIAWFGPRGLPSILFALFVVEEAPRPGAEPLLATVVLSVSLSIVAHGVSAGPLARRYARALAAAGECEEKRAVCEMPRGTRAGRRLRAFSRSIRPVPSR